MPARLFRETKLSAPCISFFFHSKEGGGLFAQHSLLAVFCASRLHALDHMGLCCARSVTFRFFGAPKNRSKKRRGTRQMKVGRQPQIVWRARRDTAGPPPASARERRSHDKGKKRKSDAQAKEGAPRARPPTRRQKVPQRQRHPGRTVDRLLIVRRRHQRGRGRARLYRRRHGRPGARQPDQRHLHGSPVGGATRDLGRQGGTSPPLEKQCRAREAPQTR